MTSVEVIAYLSPLLIWRSLITRPHLILLTLAQHVLLQQRQSASTSRIIALSKKKTTSLNWHKYRRIYYELKLQLSLHDEDIHRL